MRYDYIDVEFHQLGRKFGKAVVSALGPPILDDNVLALLVSELAKAHSQWVDEACVFCLRGHAEEADPVNLPGWLRARRKRPRNSRAADNLDKRTPPHADDQGSGTRHCSDQAKHSGRGRCPLRVKLRSGDAFAGGPLDSASRHWPTPCTNH